MKMVSVPCSRLVGVHVVAIMMLTSTLATTFANAKERLDVVDVETLQTLLSLDSRQTFSQLPNLPCISERIVNETRDFLSELCGDDLHPQSQQPACHSDVVAGLSQGCKNTSDESCYDAITTLENDWFKTCMEADVLVCGGYVRAIVPILQMLDSSAKMGLMPLFVGVSTYTNTNFSDPAAIAAAIPTFIGLLVSFDQEYTAFTYLGDYGRCNSIQDSDYWLFTAGAAGTSFNLGVCLPTTCRALNVSAIDATPGVSVVDVTMMQESISKGMAQDSGFICVVLLLSLFGVLGIIATLLDMLHAFQQFQIDGPNQTHLAVRGPKENTEDVFTELDDDTKPDSVLLSFDGSVNNNKYNNDDVNKDNSSVNNNNTDVSTPFKKPREENHFLACFSMYRNLPKLLSTKKAAGSIDCFNGLRVISMLWVILGHIFLFGGFESPLSANPLLVFQVMKIPYLQFVLNAFFSVDTFFYMSGFLVSYGLIGKMEKLKITSYGEFFRKLPLYKLYLYRYVRLTPLYAIVIGMAATFPPYLGDGPMYQQNNGPDSGMQQICKKYWWTNLLYINPFFGDNGQCVGQSWYLSNDFIFYLLAPFFIVPMHICGLSVANVKYNRGLWFAAIVVLAMSIGCTVHSAKYNIRANIIASIANPVEYSPSYAHNNLYSTVVKEYYFMPWFRIQPYIVGIVFGYFVKKDLLPRRIPMPVVFCGYALFFILAYLMIWGLSGEINIDCTNNSLSTLLHSYNPHECQGISSPTPMWADALYNGFARGVWAMMLSVLTYLCHYGYGSFIGSFLGSGAWLPLARLTFGAYLIHLMQLQLFYFNKHDQWRVTVSGLFEDFVLNAIISYVYAFLLVIFIEFPVGQLFKLATQPSNKN
eukprot:m.198847 g.198847  ORF g.198847 m.198847 type:complete len:870 (+) comp32710_c0_seq1:294-2903(+)